MLTNIACVLFDLDGTLIDTVDLIHRSFDYALRKVLGQELSRTELLKNMGRPLAAQMQHFSKSKAGELLDAYNEHNLSLHDQYISAYPGAVETLKWLKSEKKLRLGIVTSKKRDLCLRGLDLTHLREYFEVVIAMEDTTHHKPQAEPVLAALGQIGARPPEAVFVGDSPFDIMAGNQAQVYTGAALWGPFDPDLLRAVHPDFELNNLSELRVFLK